MTTIAMLFGHRGGFRLIAEAEFFGFEEMFP